MDVMEYLRNTIWAESRPSGKERSFQVLIRIEQLATDVEFDYDDTDDAMGTLVGDYEYTVEVGSREEAKELALDRFRKAVPSQVLEDFHVEARCELFIDRAMEGFGPSR